MSSIYQYIRTVPNFPIEGVQFRDITGILEDPAALHDTIACLSKVASSFNASTIIGIESRGFIFASPIAWDFDLPMILARKPGKLPNKTVSKEYDLEYGSAELHLQEISPINGKVVIVDDLIATGGTALACADLVHSEWGIPKEDILVLAVIDLPDLGGSNLIKAQGYNVTTLVEFEGE